MIGSRQDFARLQSDFYRDQYRKVLRWIMGAIVIIYLLIAIIIYTILVQPPISYYANTVSGKIIPMPRAGE